ncbi:hypothetical protein E7Z59_11600 [Robertkochia marina]|uniref:BIG2 domain-containing protein n=1 Tax=Robertkochia marina TaxID=1227945 RepID=A0A4V3UXY7_9FLAO|nr:M64 family metallopeptidase [Robertkochia marina]THD66444.1 hypothetical protein E7Z59_11600 [Robertkochia marina]TRZ44121.1 hypothetical protein D3A96_09410 [Robertkochia marina]
MASWIQIYPTSSIFLLVGQTMQLSVRDYNNPSTILNTSADGTEYHDFNSSIATIVNGKVTAIAVGETIGRVRHTDGVNITDGLVRVMVKENINEIWIGNNQATIRSGADNYVLTVYAKFTDNSFGDISSHPFLNWSSNDSTKISVDGEGRIKGEGSTGDSANITVSFGAASSTIIARVSDAFQKERPILDRVYGSGDFKDKMNILFLGEGFSTIADRSLFDHVVTGVVDNLFNSPNQVPYNVLRDDFNVWVAFESSSESGVTPSMPVQSKGFPVPSFTGSCTPNPNYNFQQLVQFVGLPDSASPNSINEAKLAWKSIPGFDEDLLTNNVFRQWNSQRIIGYMQAKDSLLGFKMGVRWGERNHSRDTSLSVKNWYIPGPVRRTSPDRRRLFSDWNYFRPLNEYIKSLRVPGLAAGDPNFDIHSTWLSGGNDESLVCILVNDDIRGGTNYGRIATSIGKSKRYIINFNGNLIDHVPSINDKQTFIGAISSTIAHEFAHSFDLGDEYEGYDDPSHHGIDIANISQTKKIDRFINLTHFGKVQDSTGIKIVGTKIPWNWPRIEKLSVIKNQIQKIGVDGVKVKLRDSSTANSWGVLPAGTEVFLRHKDINQHNNSSTYFQLGPLTIDSVSGEDVILKGGQPSNVSQLPAKSQLFIPLKDLTGNILSVIDPAIITHLNSTGLPFARKKNCARCDRANGVPDSGISNFNYPRFRTETIGLYEGGGTYNCRVYRPSGTGRMRTMGSLITLIGTLPVLHYVPIFIPLQKDIEFSFVDKYVIVNSVNPEKLPLINLYYPM